MSDDALNFAFEPRHDRPGEEDWRWQVCAGRIERDVLALFGAPPGLALAEAYEAVAHDVRAAAALRLERQDGRYDPPLLLTAADHDAWLAAGRPDGDLKL